MKKNKSLSLFSGLICGLISISFLSPVTARAQEPAPLNHFPQESEPKEASSQGSASNKKATKIKVDFEDQLVTGKHDMPEAEYIFTRTQFNYKKMIRLRDNFIPEVKQGKDEFRGRN